MVERMLDGNEILSYPFDSINFRRNVLRFNLCGK